MNDLQNINVK